MRKYIVTIVLLFGLAGLPFAVAAQDEEGDSMDPVSEGLPQEAAEEGKENSEQGLNTAEQAREDGQEYGESQSEAAREGGKDFGRDQADDQAPDAGSGSDRPDGGSNRP